MARAVRLRLALVAALTCAMVLLGDSAIAAPQLFRLLPWTWFYDQGQVTVTKTYTVGPTTPSCVGTAVSGLSDTTVNAAITAAASGDTLCLPAGSATWTTPVAISGKAISIKGVGAGTAAQCAVPGQTTYTCITADSGATAFTITASATNFVTLSNLTCTGGSGASTLICFNINGTLAEVAYRIHHVNMYDGSLGQGYRLAHIEFVYGLWDHDIFQRDQTTGSVQSVEVMGSSDNADEGYLAWTHAYNRGSNEANYFEDDQFINAQTWSESIIENYSGRSVLRFSTITNGHTGSHGVDSGGRRGPQGQEEYGNSFVYTTGGSIDAGTVRGGTAVYWGNTYTAGGHWTGIQLVYYRVTGLKSYWNFAGWNYCDSTQYDLVAVAPLSDVGLTQTTTYGSGGGRFQSTDNETLCGGAASGTCTRPFDGAGTDGYPCRDQPGISVGQVAGAFPIYIWNNNGQDVWWNETECGLGTGHGSPLCEADPTGHNLEHWVASDRDVFSAASGVQSACPTGVNCSPFNGTTGVGWGTLANRPGCVTPGCTLNVAYFATDQGSWNTSTSNPYGVQQNGADGVLYRWNGSSWVTYYTPYTYPHPLNQ